MATKYKLITVRIDLKSAEQISAQLKNFGSSSMSDFIRLAISEKLERTSISTFISEQIERIEDRQRKLDSATSALLKMQEMNANNATELMHKTAENLAKIASKLG